MTGLTNSPPLIKGGIVLIDPQSANVERIIALQYNPETLSRTLQAQAIGGDGTDRSEALRIKGPAIETLKLDAEIDATDQLEFPRHNQNSVELGVYPSLAALETLIYPTSRRLLENNNLAQSGTLEITPMEAPLTLFIWSKHRILPVRLTEFSVTEEAFDAALNPIRAKVSLGMRVLTVDDLGFNHKGGSLFMSYLQAKEQLLGKAQPGVMSTLGIRGIP